jgi:hypothetical protein
MMPLFSREARGRRVDVLCRTVGWLWEDWYRRLALVGGVGAPAAAKHCRATVLRLAAKRVGGGWMCCAGKLVGCEKIGTEGIGWLAGWARLRRLNVVG